MLCFLFALSACVDTPVENNTYDVSFELDGGEFVDETENITEADHGTAISEPQITKDGYRLVGWYSDSTMNTLYDFTTPVVGDIIVYAKWAEVSARLRLINGPMVTISDLGFGDSLDDLVADEIDGYTFEGFYLDEDFTMALQAGETLTEDMDLYVNYVANEYTVTFNLDSNVVYTETYHFGELITIPDEYEFEGVIYNTVVLREDDFEIPVYQGVTMPAEDIDLHFIVDNSIDTLVIYFVPSRPADEILTITEPLKDLLMDELYELGYEVWDVEIFVASTYEAAGEAMLAGIADLVFLPGTTYVQFKDSSINTPMDIILTATRGGLTKDSEHAIDWNDGVPTDYDMEQMVGHYRSLLLAGTSDAARTLADKVNSGAELVWDDIKDLNFCIRSATSSSGYIYPTLWLLENFGKTYYDVEGTVTQTGGYGDTMASLATGTCDIGNIYTDARMHYADEWIGEFGRTLSIWDETDVIGVSRPIVNDGIVANTDNLSPELIEAIQEAFLNMAETEEGLEWMSIYSHQGYQIADDSDYDHARAASDISNGN